MGLLGPGSPVYERFVRNKKHKSKVNRIEDLEKEVLELKEELVNTKKYVKDIEYKLDLVLYNTNR